MHFTGFFPLISFKSDINILFLKSSLELPVTQQLFLHISKNGRGTVFPHSFLDHSHSRNISWPSTCLVYNNSFTFILLSFKKKLCLLSSGQVATDSFKIPDMEQLLDSSCGLCHQLDCAVFASHILSFNCFLHVKLFNFQRSRFHTTNVVSSSCPKD